MALAFKAWRPRPALGIKAQVSMFSDLLRLIEAARFNTPMLKFSFNRAKGAMIAVSQSPNSNIILSVFCDDFLFDLVRKFRRHCSINPQRFVFSYIHMDIGFSYTDTRKF